MKWQIVCELIFYWLSALRETTNQIAVKSSTRLALVVRISCPQCAREHNAGNIYHWTLSRKWWMNVDCMEPSRKNVVHLLAGG